MQTYNNRKSLVQSMDIKKTKPCVHTHSRKRPVFSTNSELRVLSLSEILKRDIIIEPESDTSDDKSYPNSVTSSDSDQVECLVRLIRMEIRRFISKMNLNKKFVKKSDLPTFPNATKSSKTCPSKTLLYNGGETILQKHDYISSGSDIMIKKEDETLNEQENASLSEQDSKWTTGDEEGINICSQKRSHSSINKISEHKMPQGNKDNLIFEKRQDGNVKSVHIMLTMNKNSKKHSTSEKSSKTKHRTFNTENKIIQNIASRLKFLEGKLNSIDVVLLKRGILTKESRLTNSPNEIKYKKHCENHDRLKLNMTNQIEKESRPIQADEKKSLHIIPTVLKTLHETDGNPYDKPYHESRHHKKNSLHYKKSHRSLRFNAQPKMNQSSNPRNIPPKKKYNLT